jgi:hypothetical protein
MTNQDVINPEVPPSGTGCVECLATDGWWLHLRCAQCGHIGCCDSSPSQHAKIHAASANHPVVRTFEPGEDWYWNYVTSEFSGGPALRTRAEDPRTASP